MEEQTKEKLRVLFTPKANSALESIMDEFNLRETPEEYIKKIQQGKMSNIVVIDQITKDFAVNGKKEPAMAEVLQKEINLPTEIAGKLAKEIFARIMPFLEKYPEKNWEDPEFVKELARKMFGGPKEEDVNSGRIKAPAFLNVEENEKLLREEREGHAEPGEEAPRFEAPTVPPVEKLKPQQQHSQAQPRQFSKEPEEKSKLPKNPIAPRPKANNGPDKYREQV